MSPHINLATPHDCAVAYEVQQMGGQGLRHDLHVANHSKSLDTPNADYTRDAPVNVQKDSNPRIDITTEWTISIDIEEVIDGQGSRLKWRWLTEAFTPIQSDTPPGNRIFDPGVYSVIRPVRSADVPPDARCDFLNNARPGFNGFR